MRRAPRPEGARARRVLLSGLVACIVLAVVGDHLRSFRGQLDVERLDDQLDAAWSAVSGVIALPNVQLLAAFLVGAISGWAGAIHWLNSRISRRSLILLDYRRPDMPLAVGVQHVRSVGSPAARASDEAAVALIYEAARRGKLSLWRQASPDTMRRISRRQLRRARPDMLLSSRADEAHPLAGGRFSLLRYEVELLWPRLPVIEATAIRAKVR